METSNVKEITKLQVNPKYIEVNHIDFHKLGRIAGFSLDCNIDGENKTFHQVTPLGGYCQEYSDKVKQEPIMIMYTYIKDCMNQNRLVSTDVFFKACEPTRCKKFEQCVEQRTEFIWDSIRLLPENNVDNTIQ